MLAGSSELDDIFAVQDDIAGSVARALNVRLLGGEAPTPSPHRGNTQAYNLYLQGRHFADRLTPEDTEKAIAYYRPALDLDAGFAPAWAGLGVAYFTQGDTGALPHREAVRRAHEAVERTLELDPNLTEAREALGFIRRNQDWDWPGARAAYDRALALEPGNARVIRGSASLAATP